ncbi:MAG: hypothetical protein M3Y34_00790, partial [Actinomycetota bacterium]|nr:hypothetical protein [Actinomycetota bacterium]
GYDPPILSNLQMVSEDLDKVIKKRRFRIRGTSSHPATFRVYLHLYRSPEKSAWPDALVGALNLEFTAAGEQEFKVPIHSPDFFATRNHALDALRAQKRKAKVGVHPFEGDVDPVSANAIVYRR